jgi:hypothetical protein
MDLRALSNLGIAAAAQHTINGNNGKNGKYRWFLEADLNT